jgi:hypothetical protein
VYFVLFEYYTAHKESLMKKRSGLSAHGARRLFIAMLTVSAITACIGTPAALDAQTAAPGWVNSLEAAFPARDWVAAVGSGTSRQAAEAAAMNALARAFKTDVASLTHASQQFSQILSSASGKQ